MNASPGNRLSRWRSYHDVDATSEAAVLSSQLDDIASVGGVAAGKRRSLELLDLALGGHVLDVGCGNGPELGRLTEMVGPAGRVVGLDRSSALIGAAAERGLAELGPIELVVGDGHSLPFADGTFDACRADRTLQHLAQPDVALGEMARVTRSGGRVVVTESRWGLVAPSLDGDVTRHVLQTMETDQERENWLGYLLPLMFQLAGLSAVHIVRDDYTVSDYGELSRFISLEWSVERAVGAAAVTREQADHWCETLRRLVARDEAFVAIVIVHIVGEKP